MSQILLQTHNLTKEFKGFTAVCDVNLSVRKGSIHALIGPNGAGKTTCFNLLTKFLEPTRGTILFDGVDITREKPADIARRGIIRSFQISAVFPHLSVIENVRLGLQRALGTTYHFWKSARTLDHLNERAMQLLEEVGLASFADEASVNLSYGRKRALEIATTLSMEPKLMLLDEPTQGMGHEDVHRVTELIKRLSAGRTVLMVEHNMSVVATIADTITVLQRGAVLAEGSYAEVSSNPQVLEAYMGAADGELEGRTDMPLALQISDLHAWYGESHVLHGVDLHVREGEVVTLLGRNGAGRSTTLRAILGLTGARKGRIKVFGQETIALATHRIAPLGIGYCPEERGIFASLSVEENLLLPPRLKGSTGGMSVEDIYGMFPNLAERRRSQGTRLSGGEQQMLAVGRILRTGARLLLLDEISEGLAPVIVQALAGMIRTLRQSGYTVLMVEQNFRFAAPLADRFYVMEHGRVAETFNASELSARMPLLKEMLGV